MTWTFTAGRGKERGWIKEYLERDNLHNDRRKGHWREQKIMWNRAIKKVRVKHRLWGIPGEEQSGNSLVYSLSFQQSAIHEFLSQRRYLFIQSNGYSCFTFASSYGFCISHTIVLTALLYLLHLYIATPQTRCRVQLCSEFSAKNSVTCLLWSAREHATPLSLVLVWPANQVGYSWKNHSFCVILTTSTLGTVSDFMLRCLV